MRDGYTKGLICYGGNRRIFRPQGDPLSSRVSDCLATPLSLASSWKSKGAARRIAHGRAAARCTFIILLRRAVFILIVRALFHMVVGDRLHYSAFFTSLTTKLRNVLVLRGVCWREG